MMRMTREHIVATVTLASEFDGEVTVHTTDGQTVTGTCTFAGVNKFRVDTPLAAAFFTYDEVEAVE